MEHFLTNHFKYLLQERLVQTKEYTRAGDLDEAQRNTTKRNTIEVSLFALILITTAPNGFNSDDDVTT